MHAPRHTTHACMELTMREAPEAETAPGGRVCTTSMAPWAHLVHVDEARGVVCVQQLAVHRAVGALRQQGGMHHEICCSHVLLVFIEAAACISSRARTCSSRVSRSCRIRPAQLNSDRFDSSYSSASADVVPSMTKAAWRDLCLQIDVGCCHNSSRCGLRFHLP